MIWGLELEWRDGPSASSGGLLILVPDLCDLVQG